MIVFNENPNEYDNDYINMRMNLPLKRRKTVGNSVFNNNQFSMSLKIDIDFQKILEVD